MYHWNAADGFLGLPKRKLQIEYPEPCLLYVAYLGGGQDWQDGSLPEKSMLCLILYASPFSQTDQNYYKFFDLYHREALSQTFSAVVNRLPDYDRACWLVQRSCTGLSDIEIDTLIDAMVKWHYQEIRRIINYRYPSFS